MMFCDKNKWFTFIEILWVLAIIAILLSISTISFRHSQAKARDIVRKSDLQMIADALISYGNDHWHFPSSIYDNWQALTVSQALNMVADWWIYLWSWSEILFYPDSEILQNILMIDSDNFDEDMFDKVTVKTEDWLQSLIGRNFYTLKKDVSYPHDSNYEIIDSIIKNEEKNTAIKTNASTLNMNYSIVTQWMCASSLKKYLVDEWYISSIPQDPSWESINLQTNICANPNAIEKWINANDTWWSINNGCLAYTNSWCTQICKEWYIYISDGIHFALIAHMENENWWNYETTSCGLCEAKQKCGSGGDKLLHTWTSTDQLPCDITDEFRNTFNCIQNTWLVEYNTWQYYFYIY